MRYIDLFSGCGGLSLGLHRAGYEGLFAIEKDPMAFETLRTNFLSDSATYPGFGSWPAWLDKAPHDITSLLEAPEQLRGLESLRGEVDLVAGGPPCQGFSVGGSRNGADQRNSLVRRFLDVVEIVRPRAVLVENVEGMARAFQSKPGVFEASAADYVHEQLRASGYQSAQAVVDASTFGVPQIRRRLIIFAIRDFPESLRDKLGAYLEFGRMRVLQELGLPPGRPTSARDAIGDLNGDLAVECPDSPGFLSGTYCGEPSSRFAQLMRGGIPAGSVPNSHRFSHHSERILEIYRLAHATQKPGRLPRQFLLNLGTKKDKKVLVDPDLPVSTITTHPDEFIHYDRARNVSVREMARFQSFPDNFAFRGRYTINGPRRRFDVARCSQVGNAVPPLLAQGLGYAILAAFGAAEAERAPVLSRVT